MFVCGSFHAPAARPMRPGSQTHMRPPAVATRAQPIVKCRDFARVVRKCPRNGTIFAGTHLRAGERMRTLMRKECYISMFSCSSSAREVAFFLSWCQGHGPHCATGMQAPTIYKLQGPCPQYWNAEQLARGRLCGQTLARRCYARLLLAAVLAG